MDDIVITGASIDEINALKVSLSNEFKLKDLGSLKHFLGLEIARTEDGIFISQRQYTLQLLEDAGLLAAKPTNYPMDPKCKYSNFEGPLLENQAQYRRLIGHLMYLTITRPDIAYAVNCLSQFVTQPRVPHMTAATHWLRFLKSAPGQGLFLLHITTKSLQ